MIHGQAIGIPFRRRKGEQAPPPPKEVAWNPTIESNLPYKEVKYFKFVEGAGWQALNIGEILPVGNRVMIRIVTTEPYYEVSKAVSSQLANIQIGKNGESEYDIAGELTIHSPQILTVTIGVSKDYVQWNPVITSNTEYKSVKYYKLVDTSWKAINVGDYVLVGQRILTQISTVGIEDEVVAAVSEQLDIYGISKNSNGEYNVLGITSSESPQNINITIDEYIRYEDIVQAYPLFFEFTDENGNLISWGGKAKVGSTITRTKGVAYANLLEGLFTITNPRLNGVPLASAEHVVEKSMVFTCTATWTFDDNEPKCVLSSERLRIPNASYKILGHIPDISGHGNHGVFNNFEFAGMSGANGYLQNFKSWKYRPSNNSQQILITDSSVSIKSELSDEWIIWNQVDTQKFKIRIIGLPTGGAVRYRYFDTDNVQHDLNFDSNGIWECPANTDAGSASGFSTIGNKALYVGLTIEQIGEYEGAICFNGNPNFVSFPTLPNGGKQVLMKVNWQRGSLGNLLYDQRSAGSDSSFAILVTSIDDDVNNKIAYQARNANGVTYIDGVKNEYIETGTLENITHNITIANSSQGNRMPVLGASNRSTPDFFSKYALYDFMCFDEISEDDKIQELNEYVGIEPKVEVPDYYWDCFGKTNDDPDRDTIAEQVSKDAANALSVKNADFKLDNGFGKYEVDFAAWDVGNSAFTVYANKLEVNKESSTFWMYSYTNMTENVPSYKIRISNLQQGYIRYYYRRQDGIEYHLDIHEDGVFELPMSYKVEEGGTGINGGFNSNGSVLNAGVIIEQIPEYPNGFVFNGKAAYLENLNVSAISDFTVIAKRIWADETNVSFIAKGSLSNIQKEAFLFESDEGATKHIYSFGKSNVISDGFPSLISFSTKVNYNGAAISSGEAIDDKGLYVGLFLNKYWKGVFYKLMLYAKTIDILSINMLKNLFTQDEIININHPIFKKS